GGEGQRANVVGPTDPLEKEAAKLAEGSGAVPKFRWPANGRVIASYGPTTNGQQNDGINIALPENTPVKAAEDGVVAYAGNELKGYGNLVLVRHPNGYVTAYAHAKELLVKRGDPVKRGQVIARSGQTGNVNAPQLHFEIRRGAAPFDPTRFLTGAGAAVSCPLPICRRVVPPGPGRIARPRVLTVPRAWSPIRALRGGPHRAAGRCGSGRRSRRPWPGIRPGCNGESRAKARNGPTAKPSPRSPRPD